MLLQAHCCCRSWQASVSPGAECFHCVVCFSLLSFLPISTPLPPRLSGSPRPNHCLEPVHMCGPLSTRIHQAFLHHVMCLFDTSFSSCIEFVSFFASTHFSCVFITSSLTPPEPLLFSLAPPELPLHFVAPPEHSLLSLNCDAALHSLAETWSTDAVVLREHGIRLYVGFRNDIFLIGSDRRLSVSYVQELRRRAKYFHIIPECPRDSEVQFLEMKVWKSGTRYHTAPCPKPTSLGIPLDETSAQPPRVHLSVPVGTMSRVQGLSTHCEHAEAAKVTLVNRFRRHRAPLFLIDLLKSTPAWNSNFGPTPCLKSQVLWLPLGFQPTLHRTLSKAVADLSKFVQWKQLYSMVFGVACPCVRLSWYNSLRSQATIIKQLDRK